MVRAALLTGLLACAWVALSLAQPYGNEWINYQQTYYKIPVGQTGLYRVTYADLQAAGFPVGVVDPRRVQLYHRGVEQAIRVVGGIDARWDAGDYLEFIGQRNDGTQDTDLYVSPDAQPHAHYNLYSDTTAYFLTWRLTAGAVRRMEVIDERNVSGIPTEPYHHYTSRQIMATQGSLGRLYPQGSTSAESYLSEFDYGEGWTGSPIRDGQSITLTFADLFSGATTADPPDLHLVLQGRNNRQHSVTVLVGPDASNLRSLSTVTWPYYNFLDTTLGLSWADVSGSGTLVVRLTANGVDGTDRISASLAEVTLPQSFNAQSNNSYLFGWSTNQASRTYAVISNVPEGARFFNLTEPDQPQEWIADRSGSGVTLVGEATASTMPVQMETVVRTPRIEKVVFRNYSATAKYLIVTHPGLRQPVDGVADPVSAYAAYRASATGGGYDTLIANVTQLYDQFGYGEITPLAIRRFIAYQLSRGTPEYLFLVGKSRYWFNNYHRRTDLDPNYPSWFPAMGHPGSDLLYSMGLGGEPRQAALATGRLNAITSRDVLTHLNKVQAVETAGFDNPWRKRLLHLSGGASPFELNNFRIYINRYADIAEGEFLGAKVQQFSKSTDDVVEIFNVSGAVNEGIGLLMMFGHSGAQRTDIDIGYVSDDVFGYNNVGLYPLIYVNGCNAGDIFQGFGTFGEDWMLTPNKGAAAFIAHSATGFSSELRDFTSRFYEIGYTDTAYVGASIAEVLRQTSLRYLEMEPFVGERQIAQSQQMVLQGDPALALFGATKPDVRVAENGISLSAYPDGAFSAEADSLRLDIIVENVGLVLGDTLWVTVNHTLPSGTLRTLDTIPYPLPHFVDTLSYNLPMGLADAAGTNTITVILDPSQRLDELSEVNNQAEVGVFIPAGTHLNLLPTAFGVVTEPTVTLLAQANDVLAPARSMAFQLDTTHTFSSPALQSELVNSSALLTWEVDLPITLDSTVYYWRTRFTELLPSEDTAWQESSFVYVGSGTAQWAQSHPGQWRKNARYGLDYEPTSGAWTFPTNEVPVEVLTYGDQVSGVNRTSVQLTIDNQNYIFALGDDLDSLRFCRDNSVNAIAFDRQTGFPYKVLTGERREILNNISCGRQPQVINNFTQANIISADRWLNQYLDGVNDGDWVVLFSIGTIDPSAWPTDVLDALEAIGTPRDSLLSLASQGAFVFVGQKNAAPTTLWESGAANEMLTVATEIFGQFTQGTITSATLGPATVWESLEVPTIPLATNDGLTVNVLGVRANASDTVLLADVPFGSTSLTSVDANQWPQLRLEARVTDAVDFTPPQMRQWWVSYTAPPEGILLPAPALAPVAVQEGEEASFPFQFLNLSNQAFSDSLDVVYTLTNEITRAQSQETTRLPAVAANDTASFTFATSTVGMGGNNSLEVSVNREGSVPEQRLVNNTLRFANQLAVERDSTHPLLDVLVEGRYILDGELVSPSPLVLVRLRDENTLLQKEDTIGVELFFKTACEGCDFERIPFTDPRIRWTPASEEQDFQLEFQPVDLPDGQYSLRIQATDASGNASGTEPYQVSFSVVNAATVTRFYPYPNPFSTSCRFVFTLTGSTIPDDIRIQILTISGKVVRTITREELGPLHIGNNLTQFAWDGTDQYGQRLANGVYLYRVRVEHEGEAVEINPQAADERAFTREYGKLYILR